MAGGQLPHSAAGQTYHGDSVKQFALMDLRLREHAPGDQIHYEVGERTTAWEKGAIHVE